ncbi:ceramidase [Propylenella binzhouense]|uniref:Ceramidase n=1 Tax=Propylenella binzhouense TaxID=2555902 RepID=A0A964WT14_9HYPH|nr:ceramidase [Propylenella binzhouense]MYZ47466.1 hypothetical protein [Propylenella binzhouense]
MDWFAPIDLYCERLGPGFWAEPFGATSNLAFIGAASLAGFLYRRERSSDPAVAALIALVFVIGIGSFLFHTFANGWSVLADTIPIAVFIYGYLALALRRFVGISWPAALLGLVVFAALSFALEIGLRPFLGGSAGYVPALFAMLGIGLLLFARGRPVGGTILAAGAIFLVSLGFRIADLPLCPALPIGTHFLWHILNATTLGLLLVAAIRYPPPDAAAIRQPS